MKRPAYLLELGLVPYLEAWELQRSLAARVTSGELPDTIVLLEHPPVVTLGRRSDENELHLPPGAEVEIVETDRGGKSTYHGPGQLVAYPILDLNRHGRDVKRYCRDLEEALVQTLGRFEIDAGRIDGLTGVWLQHATRPRMTKGDGDGAAAGHDEHERERRRGPRKIASIGIHVSRWVTTHGYALNVDLDPSIFTDWITACGLEDAQFTSIARELERPVGVDEVRPVAAEALAEVFGLELARAPAELAA